MITNTQGGIYRIKNLETGAMYIGKTAQTFAKRWGRHRRALRSSRHRNAHLQSSYNKHGPAAFEYKVLEVIPRGDMSDKEFIEHMNEREVILIAEYDARQNGYNQTDGGGGALGWDPAPETKAKISKAQIGKKKALGYRHTDEARANMSASKTGKPWSTERRARHEAKKEAARLNSPTDTQASDTAAQS